MSTEEKDLASEVSNSMTENFGRLYGPARCNTMTKTGRAYGPADHDGKAIFGCSCAKCIKILEGPAWGGRGNGRAL